MSHSLAWLVQHPKFKNLFCPRKQIFCQTCSHYRIHLLWLHKQNFLFQLANFRGLVPLCGNFNSQQGLGSNGPSTASYMGLQAPQGGSSGPITLNMATETVGRSAAQLSDRFHTALQWITSLLMHAFNVYDQSNFNEIGLKIISVGLVRWSSTSFVIL